MRFEDSLATRKEGVLIDTRTIGKILKKED